MQNAKCKMQNAEFRMQTLDNVAAGLQTRREPGTWVAAMTVALSLVTGSPSFAQGQVEAASALTRGQVMDFAGSWANRLHEDWIERAPGP
jgi:hypothetical protein